MTRRVIVALARPIRPLGSESTQQRILTAARACYAETEYAETGLEAVAVLAGLGTEAILEHFSGRRDLFLAAVDQGETTFCERLRAVAAGEDGHAARVAAMLDEIVRLNAVDPTLIRFLQAVAADVSRCGELREAIGDPRARREALFRELVEVAIAAGELAASDLDTVVNMINAMTAGLIVTGSLMPEAQARAAEGLKRLLSGTLLGPT